MDHGDAYDLQHVGLATACAEIYAKVAGEHSSPPGLEEMQALLNGVAQVISNLATIYVQDAAAQVPRALAPSELIGGTFVRGAQAFATKQGGELRGLTLQRREMTYAISMLKSAQVAFRAPVGGAATKRAKVLVVDDEQSMRELIRLHLANAGYDVLLAEDAVAAGHLALRERPDLILLDVQMPYMNGYELISALKGDQATRNIPVVFLTTDENVAEHAGKLGAAAYLTKPVVASRLLEVLAMFAAK